MAEEYTDTLYYALAPVQAGARLRATETEVSAAPWAMCIGKDFTFYFFYTARN